MLHAPSGFFVLRSPLLPVEALAALSAGLEAPGLPSDAPDPDLDAALARDHERVSAAVISAAAGADLREAIRVASEDLDRALAAHLSGEAPKDPRRAARLPLSLYKYVARASQRPTPFGLFAGVSMGGLGGASACSLPSRERLSRRTRIDRGILDAIARALASDPEVRRGLLFRPNPTAWRHAGWLRYVEARPAPLIAPGAAPRPAAPEEDAVQRVSALEIDEALEATLARAAPGASIEALAAPLVDGENDADNAVRYVERLIEEGALVSDLEAPLTGDAPVGALAAALDRAVALGAGAAAGEAAGRLRELDAALARIDGAGIVPPVGAADGLAQALSRLPGAGEVAGAPRVQVELWKPAPGLRLGAAVLEEAGRALDLLDRLAPRGGPDALTAFREAFERRFERREVPLLHALDDDAGVGFGGGAAAAPLLVGLGLGGRAAPRGGDTPPPLDARDALLVRRAAEALGRGAPEVTLSEKDLETLAPPRKSHERSALPDALALLATLVAADAAAVDRGDLRLLVHGASGPSGANLLARFADLDLDLRAAILAHLRAEEALHPGAVLAEVVHLPVAARTGNILARPVLRAFEIPILGASGAPSDRQIRLDDLLVSVTAEGAVRLRSVRLGKEVLPRLSSAHNVDAPGELPVYRFLVALARAGGAGARFDWGRAASLLPSLPRVTAGRIVLARARWRLYADEVKALAALRGAARHRRLRAWREERRAPRSVSLVDFDNELPVDLESALAVEALLRAARDRPAVDLVETFPGPGETPFAGPEGRFANEVVIPFVRAAASARAAGGDDSSLLDGARPSGPAWMGRSVPSTAEARGAPPGSRWLFLKLYAGPLLSDRVLLEVAAPVVEEARALGVLERWFFIRYEDEDGPHLRLRLRGLPRALLDRVLPSLDARAAPLRAAGALWRTALDTYEPEVERYGGPRAIDLVEQVFEADSEAALAIARLCADAGEAADEDRWRLALRGMDGLLAAAGLDLDARRALVRTHRERMAREQGIEGHRKTTLDERWRRERARIEAALLEEPADDEGDVFRAGAEALALRDARIAPVLAAMRRLGSEGGLEEPLDGILTSLLHTHVIRALAAAPRAQEAVLSDLLNRVYATRLARRRAGV